MDIRTLDPGSLADLSTEDLTALVGEVQAELETDRQENQIAFYRPVSEMAWDFHRSSAKVRGLGGGNRAGKTTTPLVEMVALATGCFPDSIREEMVAKFKGPLRIRLTVESLTTTLHPIILPKLQWYKWSGQVPAGGSKGHWGWIPRRCLIDGEWDRSWSEKFRTLTVLCYDPERPDKVLGKSTIQCMSYDQDASDFASGDFDFIHHDEPPPFAIWRENEARVMSVGGSMTVAMTWPDDPSIPVDWIFDEVYEKGIPGPEKVEGIDWFELDTRRNPHLDQQSIAEKSKNWDAVTRAARIGGKPLRFSNRIHPLFTDRREWWSFPAGKVIEPLAGGQCPETGSFDTVEFCHVETFEHSKTWPVVFLLDPHPRKPHMMLWAQINPLDDIDVLAYLDADADPVDLEKVVDQLEREHGLQVVSRIGDPNMLRSPASAKRNVTWEDEFAAAGLSVQLADDSDVGRQRFNEYLKPDSRTRRPRIRFHTRCSVPFRPGCEVPTTQIKRFVWEDWRRKDEKDLKNKPRAKFDDYPGLVRYLMNSNPDFKILAGGAPILHTGRHARGRR